MMTVARRPLLISALFWGAFVLSIWDIVTQSNFTLALSTAAGFCLGRSMKLRERSLRGESAP